MRIMFPDLGASLFIEQWKFSHIFKPELRNGTKCKVLPFGGIIYRDHLGTFWVNNGWDFFFNLVM